MMSTAEDHTQESPAPAAEPFFSLSGGLSASVPQPTSFEQKTDLKLIPLHIQSPEFLKDPANLSKWNSEAGLCQLDWHPDSYKKVLLDLPTSTAAVQSYSSMMNVKINTPPGDQFSTALIDADPLPLANNPNVAEMTPLYAVEIVSKDALSNTSTVDMDSRTIAHKHVTVRHVATQTVLPSFEVGTSPPEQVEMACSKADIANGITNPMSSENACSSANIGEPRQALADMTNIISRIVRTPVANRRAIKRRSSNQNSSIDCKKCRLE